MGGLVYWLLLSNRDNNNDKRNFYGKKCRVSKTGQHDTSPFGFKSTRICQFWLCIEGTSDATGLFGHHLYFDNFFSWNDLETFIFAKLLKRDEKIHHTPLDMKKGKDMRRGMDFYVGSGWTIMKSCSLVTIVAQPAQKSLEERRMVEDYNTNMGFVDKMGMLKSFYNVVQKSRMWWYHIFWYSVDVFLVNSYIFFWARVERKSLNLKTFNNAWADRC